MPRPSTDSHGAWRNTTGYRDHDAGRRFHAVEAWLHDEVAAAYDAVVADPSRAVAASALRVRLGQR